MIRFVAFGDVHSETKYVKKLFDFCKRFKPTHIILCGDIFDFSDISDYERHKLNSIGLNQCIKNTLNEIKWGKQLLDYIDENFKKSRKYFIEGNHDVRFDKFFTYEYPQAEYNKLSEVIKLKERGWERIELGGYLKIGKLYFMHGERFQGDLFAKQAAMKLRKNVRLWHNHTNQSYTITSPLDSSDIVECKSIGCLCSKDPVYLKGITNRWINSFLVGFIDEKTGNFQDFVVNIIDGKILFPLTKL